MLHANIQNIKNPQASPSDCLDPSKSWLSELSDFAIPFDVLRESASFFKMGLRLRCSHLGNVDCICPFCTIFTTGPKAMIKHMHKMQVGAQGRLDLFLPKDTISERV